jgi:hypothetical protein
MQLSFWQHGITLEYSFLRFLNNFVSSGFKGVVQTQQTGSNFL